jgi:hypothetical protein
MTVWIYVDTNKEVGRVDHLKVLPVGRPQKHGSRKTIPKAKRSNMKFLSKHKSIIVG